ncbi:hypothetical protein [Rodentibacter ratti]|uniref:Uncharacterized protein n=1 Tax=Rodentibacter ratti TaxID=1906745 RepID=A0A1V3LCZ6_9PAST|nr:hypothetical protein [Rodentibacter ratti]OOF88140.1 hypothetical protein BKG88_00395 [Rodentibacter ratti]
MKTLFYSILLLLIQLCTTVKAAEIFPLPTKYPNFFAILGPITQGDYKRLVHLTNHIPYGEATIFLNSDGGNAYEGIYIGEYVNKKGFTTVVTPIDKCYSACAVIWAAGKNKVAYLPGAIIGFHAAFDRRTREQIGSTNAILGSKLGSWGYSDSAIAFMTDAKPASFNYLNRENAYMYGIQYINGLEIDTYSIQDETRYTLAPYDVVSGFYNALSNADGDLAAAYVIPEKRGIGPFNQTNIYRFYSSMKRPLKVHNITQINESQFRVSYSFTKTKTQCNGISTVTLINRDGYYLIQSIKANC